MTQDTELPALPALPEPGDAVWVGGYAGVWTESQVRQIQREAFEAGRKAAAQECVSICMDERVEPEDGMQDETDESYNMALAHAVGAINARFGKAKP